MVKTRQMGQTIIAALAALALASCLNPQSRLGGDGGIADAGPGDACPALSCGDAQACLRGACEDRVTLFPTRPNIYHGVDQVIAGPGGLVWFLSVSRQNIGNITTEGVVTEYHAPDGTAPYFIAAGPDGNIWYADPFTNAVGCMTPSGVYSKSFSMPASALTISEIVSGADGNLWMSTNGPNIWRMTTAGDVTTFPLPTPDAGAYGLISGPDGNVWFGEMDPQVGSLPQVGRITPEGVIREFPLDSGVSPRTLASGGDGNVWLTVNGTGPVTSRQIQRMTPQGEVSVFLFPVPVEVPRALTFGPDGNIWFAEDEWDRAGIGRLTPTGEVIELVLPSPAGQSVYGMNTIVAGADGNIWFSLLYQDNIGRVIPF